MFGSVTAVVLNQRSDVTSREMPTDSSPERPWPGRIRETYVGAGPASVGTPVEPGRPRHNVEQPMRGPRTDEWLDGITPQEADAWLGALRKIHDPVSREPRPVTDHQCGPEGYCTGCPGDILWLACPVLGPP